MVITYDQGNQGVSFSFLQISIIIIIIIIINLLLLLLLLLIYYYYYFIIVIIIIIILKTFWRLTVYFCLYMFWVLLK